MSTLRPAGRRARKEMLHLRPRLPGPLRLRAAARQIRPQRQLRRADVLELRRHLPDHRAAQAGRDPVAGQGGILSMFGPNGLVLFLFGDSGRVPIFEYRPLVDGAFRRLPARRPAAHLLQSVGPAAAGGRGRKRARPGPHHPGLHHRHGGRLRLHLDRAPGDLHLFPRRPAVPGRRRLFGRRFGRHLRPGRRAARLRPAHRSVPPAALRPQQHDRRADHGFRFALYRQLGPHRRLRRRLGWPPACCGRSRTKARCTCSAA